MRILYTMKTIFLSLLFLVLTGQFSLTEALDLNRPLFMQLPSAFQPTDPQHCENLESSWSEIMTDIDAEHSACLSAGSGGQSTSSGGGEAGPEGLPWVGAEPHRGGEKSLANMDPQQVDRWAALPDLGGVSGEGKEDSHKKAPGGTGQRDTGASCSVPACQKLHELVYGQNLSNYKQARTKQCREQVKDYQQTRQTQQARRIQDYKSLDLYQREQDSRTRQFQQSQERTMTQARTLLDIYHQEQELEKYDRIQSGLPPRTASEYKALMKNLEEEEPITRYKDEGSLIGDVVGEAVKRTTGVPSVGNAIGILLDATPTARYDTNTEGTKDLQETYHIPDRERSRQATRRYRQYQGDPLQRKDFFDNIPDDVLKEDPFIETRLDSTATTRPRGRGSPPELRAANYEPPPWRPTFRMGWDKERVLNYVLEGRRTTGIGYPYFEHSDGDRTGQVRRTGRYTNSKGQVCHELEITHQGSAPERPQTVTRTICQGR